MAVCLAHHMDSYWNLQKRQWVHSSGWPCEGMADCPEPGRWADY
jgi:hypothetical protein